MWKPGLSGAKVARIVRAPPVAVPSRTVTVTPLAAAFAVGSGRAGDEQPAAAGKPIPTTTVAKVRPAARTRVRTVKGVPSQIDQIAGDDSESGRSAAAAPLGLDGRRARRGTLCQHGGHAEPET